MKIEPLKNADIFNAENLIRKVFDEYSAAEYPSEGIGYFYKMISGQSIRERFSNGSMIYIARENDLITGYLEMINCSHIYLLFVRKEYQQKGTGRALVEFSLDMLKINNPEIKNVTVNSTLSAVKAYEKLGFRKMADYQFKNGIMSYPMIMALS